MKKWIPYTWILLDISISHFHYQYYESVTSEVQWFIVLNELFLRLAVGGVFVMLDKEWDWLNKKVTWVYVGFLFLDFIEQVMDKNHGKQWWEMTLFLSTSILIAIYGKVKQRT